MRILISQGEIDQYPCSVAQFRARFKGIALPLEPTEAQLEEVGLMSVAQVGSPVSPSQVAEEATPALVNGVWTQQWTLRDKTPDELAADAQALQTSIVAATQERLDAFARTRNYDGILSACTYASSTVPKFAAEGQYCVNARDNTWATLYTLMADVQAGNWAMPTSFDDVEPLLPTLEWPV